MNKANYFNHEGCIQRGFTMTELVTIIVIIGILGAIVAPRFFDRNTFDSRGFYDQVISTLRYAQKTAIAQHRFVCVSITGNNNITLEQGATNACGGNVTDPAGAASYSITAPGGVTVDNAAFNFNALGRPSAAQDIAVSGYATHVVVEAETGYVH